jgi:hypothetical protein
MIPMFWEQDYDAKAESLSLIFQMAPQLKARVDAQVSINNKGKWGTGKHVHKIAFFS